MYRVIKNRLGGAFSSGDPILEKLEACKIEQNSVELKRYPNVFGHKDVFNLLGRVLSMEADVGERQFYFDKLVHDLERLGKKADSEKLVSKAVTVLREFEKEMIKNLGGRLHSRSVPMPKTKQPLASSSSGSKKVDPQLIEFEIDSDSEADTELRTTRSDSSEKKDPPADERQTNTPGW